MIPFSIVVAMDEKRGIGQEGKLPWHLPGELKYFRELTVKTKNPNKRNIVVMGRTTWESLPEKYRPLPNRINIILSSSIKLDVKDCYVKNSFEALFKFLNEPFLKETFESVFIIGGASIYKQAIQLPNCEKLYITHVLNAFSCDAYFPEYQNNFFNISESARQQEGPISYFFAQYQKKTLS